MCVCVLLLLLCVCDTLFYEHFCSFMVASFTCLIFILHTTLSETCPRRLTPSSMLESSLECVDECMERFELALVQFQWATSSREPLQPPKWHEPWLHAVWTVLIRAGAMVGASSSRGIARARSQVARRTRRLSLLLW